VAEVLLKMPKVRERCALSRSELYRRIRSGQFPAPVSIGSRAVAWRSSDIDAWVASRLKKPQEEHGDAGRIPQGCAGDRIERNLA